MNIQDYESLTGITVSAAREGLITAKIAYAQSLLEQMLGFTLTSASVDDNQYTETGRLDDTCPCSCNTVDEESLLDPDAVVFAYRLYTYHAKDEFLAIDPATAVHAVKLVKNGVTYRTMEEEDYRPHYENGIIKFIEQCDLWCGCKIDCDCVQLAVDADWLWEDVNGETTIPYELRAVWADMVTYYADNKKDYKSQSLGPHSWTRFDNTPVQLISTNLDIIKRYAGPNGTAGRMPL